LGLRKIVLVCGLLAVILAAGLVLRPQPMARWAAPAPSLTVDRQPVVFAMHTFYPSTPPADMPPLAAWEQAECESNLESDANVKGRTETIDATHGVVIVTGVRVTLRLIINLWVPQGSTGHVIEHEQGHREIAEHYYQTAEKVAEEVASRYLGKQISTNGTDLNGEAQKVLLQTGAEIIGEFHKKFKPDLAQNRYDDLTDHGRYEIGAEDAVAQVLREGR
jgi:hypothetical protein